MPASRADALSIHFARLSVTPSTGLVSDQPVLVSVRHASPGTTYDVTVCGPEAVAVSLPPLSAADGCDATHNSVVTVDASGDASVTLPVPAILTTAIGEQDCRVIGCVLALVALHGTGTLGIGDLLAKRITFAGDACAAPADCTVAADAWDPSLDSLPAAHLTSAPLQPRAAERAPEQPPVTVTLEPGLARPDLDAPGAITGPDVGGGLGATQATQAPPPATPQSGEGLLRLDLEAPGTSWGPGTPSSTVVDATVTDLTTGRHLGSQQLVAYWGAAPFVYAAFAGDVDTADTYRVTLRAEPPAAGGGISQPLPGRTPEVVLKGAELDVVSPTDPSYLAYAYAPVLYGRTTSALHDVPLLSYATEAPRPGGAIELSYTYVFSHEDAGTGFVPFVEYGRWGRLTDIETAISFTVEPDGKVRNAEYNSAGTPIDYPDSLTSLREVEKPFAGVWDGRHPVLRDATGNNVFSEVGATRFRFQLAPVAPPSPGANRDAVMDANPWTYQVSAEEVPRWSTLASTAADSPQPGDASQYALVDIDTTGGNVDSIDVGLRLAGSEAWYTSDQGRGVVFVRTGQTRTVVKMPLGWQSQPITGVRLAVEPPEAAASVHVVSFRVRRYDPTQIAVDPVTTPAPVVTGA